MKLPLASLTPDEISSDLALKNKFTGKQIFSWIHKCVFNFDKMTDLSKNLRAELPEKAVTVSSTIEEEFSGDDSSVKFKIKLIDGLFIEAVLLIDKTGRKTICVSSQVGCAMGCKFCRTGLMGLKRNLEAYEIIEQYLLIKARYEEISNIVFMGMGEPLANIDNVRKSILILNNKLGAGMSTRRITVSTCGIIKGIENLLEYGPKVRLAFSLITANPELRKKLIPSAKNNPLPDIKKALLKYQEKTGKRITYEIVLLNGINDSKKHIDELISFIPPVKVNINIIPWNSAEELDYKASNPKTIRDIIETLKSRNFPVTQRFRRGKGINAACGQLFTNS